MSYSFSLNENISKPLKVSELVARLKADVEKNNKNIRVIGEVSSFKQWRSGHCYFDIKDEGATLSAIIFQPHFLRLGFKVLDGQQMVFSGRASIYQASSRLQMIVESMEPLGQGALALAFEQLKEKLQSEGLFDKAHKKIVKPLNFSVGIITSSHGAVLKDMVRILKSRMPLVNIYFSSVKVQGPGSALEIKNAIELLDESSWCDVIIVGRGGGSLEDLASFNDEMVARAIFKAKTPIISAVGHETDFSISDFVADVRAATPTHAASLVVPVFKELVADINNLRNSLKLKHQSKIKSSSLVLAHLKQKLKDPRILLFRHCQEVDVKSQELYEKIKQKIVGQKLKLAELKNRLLPLSPRLRLKKRRDDFYHANAELSRLNPKTRIKISGAYLLSAKAQLHDRGQLILINARKDFKEQVMKLHALSPLGVLARGYSMVEDGKTSQILSKKSQFFINQVIKIRLQNGHINAQVLGEE